MNSTGMLGVPTRKEWEQIPKPTPQLVIDTKNSKIQHILGISEAQLSSARSQSLSSSSTVRPQGSLFSEATIAQLPSPDHSDKILVTPTTILPLHKVSSVLDRDSIDARSNKPAEAKLRYYPSTSTLHSHYDRAKAPSSISQQTSASSSRDFALRKGARAILAATTQEMEHARQLILSKSSRGTRNGSKPAGHNPWSGLKLKIAHQPSKKHSVLNLRSPTPVSTTSTISLPTTPDPMTPSTSKKLFFPSLKTTSKSPHQPIRPLANDGNQDSPYNKVHVRKPKPGARNWFDDVEGYSSEEEVNPEPAVGQAFVNEVERMSVVSDSTKGATERSYRASPVSCSSYTGITRTTRPSVPYKIVASNLPPQELPAHPVTSTPTRASRSSVDQVVQVKIPRAKSVLIAKADLTKQSVLNLSSSDDEDEVQSMLSGHGVKAAPHIRDSLAMTSVAGSEIEIGLAHAHAVKPVLGAPFARSGRPPSEASRRSRESMKTPAPLRISSRQGSYIFDIASEADGTNSDIIQSFPATPTDTGSVRTSIRSSVMSESGSLRSTRPMMVTKQEEKLLAAMRLKRAAMKQAVPETDQKDRDRRGALEMLESGSTYSVSSSRRSRVPLPELTQLDVRLSSRYAPRQAHTPRNDAIDEGMTATPDVRDSGTTFDTVIESARNSQATMRTTFSEDSQFTSPSDGRSTPTVQYRPRRQSRRDTYLSLASEASSLRRDSHVVMLDDLDETLEREPIPSQLFMESPFLGWERAGLTAAHQSAKHTNNCAY